MLLQRSADHRRIRERRQPRRFHIDAQVGGVDAARPIANGLHERVNHSGRQRGALSEPPAMA